MPGGVTRSRIAPGGPTPQAAASSTSTRGRPSGHERSSARSTAKPSLRPASASAKSRVRRCEGWSRRWPSGRPPRTSRGVLVSLIVAPGVALHEAAHVAAFMVGGDPPTRVQIDSPRDGLGSTSLDWSDGLDPPQLRRAIVAILQGPLAEGDPFPLHWPPDPAEVSVGARGDISQARRFAECLRFNSVDWYRTCWEAAQMARNPVFRRLLVALVEAFETTDVLEADDLTRIYEAAQEETTACEHVTKAAAATVTDRGEFTAIAAAWTVDRQKRAHRTAARSATPSSAGALAARRSRFTGTTRDRRTASSAASTRPR